MKPYRQPDSMKKHERQRLDWVSIRKKGTDGDKNHLIRGWLVRVCMFVCPRTNTGQENRIGRRDGKWRQCEWTSAAQQPGKEAEPEKGEKSQKAGRDWDRNMKGQTGR